MARLQRFVRGIARRAAKARDEAVAAATPAGPARRGSAEANETPGGMRRRDDAGRLEREEPP
jgi:hypothetical protein